MNERNSMRPEHVDGEPGSENRARGIPETYSRSTTLGWEPLTEIGGDDAPGELQHAGHTAAQNGHPNIAGESGMVQDVINGNAEHYQKHAVPLGQDLAARP